MNNPGRLGRVEIVPHGDDYIVQLSLEDGTSCQAIATFDQLDSLSEEIDRRLDADED